MTQGDITRLKEIGKIIKSPIQSLRIATVRVATGSPRPWFVYIVLWLAPL